MLYRIITTTMNGARLIRKAAKSSWATEPMIRFGGSPINVAVPPILEAIVSAIRNGIGGTPSSLATSKVTGATSRMVVTLSRNADRTAVANTSRIMVRIGSPFASFAHLIATYWNRPVPESRLTSSIIPASVKTTSKLE